MAKNTNTRGIPSIADYAHWNEEAEAVWYAENRYDMDNPPEYTDEDDQWYDEDEE